MGRAVLALVFLSSFALACSGDHRAELVRAARGGADAGVRPLADLAEVVAGTADRGRDPGVVAINVGHAGVCSGVLISPRLVLTSRRCTTRTTSVVCPPDPSEPAQVVTDRVPGDLAVLLGDDTGASQQVAVGVAVIAPDAPTLCDADIAVLVLDPPVTLVKPLAVATRAPAVADRVRTVSYGKVGDEDSQRRIVREHVRVVAVSDAEFQISESACHGVIGGPAIDEQTGEVFGIVSRGAGHCAGPDAYQVYSRVDTHAAVTEEAFAKASELDGEARGEDDAGAFKPAKRGTKSKPPSDVGSACTQAVDCAAGICVTQAPDTTEQRDEMRYCSRRCAEGDRCPAHFHCEPVTPAKNGDASSATACVRVE